MRRGLTGAALLLLLGGGCGGGGDGWRIAFRSDRDARWSIYAVAPDGSGLVRFLDRGSSYTTPILSPDGRKLLLPRREEIAVANIDGTGARRLAGTWFPESGTWSPDGKHIVFAGLSPGLSVIDADGTHGRRLTGNQFDDEPAWSPDGSKIAFVNGGLLTIGADGAGRELLTFGDVSEPAWSPDGRLIFFRRNDSLPPTDTTFWAIDAAGFDEREVEGYPESWSPDGRRMAFGRWVGGEYTGHLEVYVADARGRHTRRLTFGEGSSDPRWSPDGRRIVYEQASTLTELWSMRPDGSGKRALTHAYPSGSDSSIVGWVRGRLKPVPAPAPTVTPVRDGFVLRVPWPVAEIAADGGRVVIVPPGHGSETIVPIPPLLAWTPETRAISRVSLSACLAPHDLVLTGDRAVFDCENAGADVIHQSLVAVRLPAGRPQGLLDGGNSGPYPLGGMYLASIAGRGGSLVFGTHRDDRNGRPLSWKLWRVVGRRPVAVASGRNVGAPSSAEPGRMAVERTDGSVVVAHLDGRVVRRLPVLLSPRRDSPWGSPEPRAILGGRDLVVKQDRRLLVFDARSGFLARTWPIAPRATLKAVAGGLAVYVSGPRVYVVRLGDGRELVIAVPGHGSLVDADLTGRGLFYSRDVRRGPGPGDESLYVDNAARVVFVRSEALRRRLGGSS